MKEYVCRHKRSWYSVHASMKTPNLENSGRKDDSLDDYLVID